MIKYMLFDERYRTDEDDAICFEVCDNIEEAIENAPTYGDGTVIVFVERDNEGKILKEEIIN